MRYTAGDVKHGHQYPCGQMAQALALNEILLHNLWITRFDNCTQKVYAGGKPLAATRQMPNATSTCTQLDATTTQCVFSGPGTSTPPVYVGTFTAGDALISLFLFISIVISVIRAAVKSL